MAIGWFGEDIVDAAGDVLADAWDLVDDLPGFAQLGEGTKALFKGPLRDFANTGIGQSVLRAFTTINVMGPVGWVAGPWAMMASAALPGMARGDSFDDAVLSENLWRLEKTIETLGVDAGELFAQQFGTALDELRARAADMGLSPPDAVRQLAAAAGVDPEAYANALARDLGIRADAALQAVEVALREYVANHDAYDPVTGRKRLDLSRIVSDRVSVNARPSFLALREPVGPTFAARVSNVASMAPTMTMRSRLALIDPAPAAAVQDRAVAPPAEEPPPARGGSALAVVGVSAVAAAAAWAVWRYL